MIFNSVVLSCGAALMAAIDSVSAQGTGGAAPVVPDGRVSASPFPLNQIQLQTSRFLSNQDRTMSYLKDVDVNRLLYVFRATHKLSTNGAASNGGWDAPNFPFRSHAQGHFLTAWAQCYATTGDATCKSKAQAMVSGMLACQNNNGAAGFKAGYLSGFPESEITAVEKRTITSGNVPYYALHKTLAGLVDVWKHIGDNNAKTVVLAFAAWVDSRTSALSYTQMQNMLGTEHGGMIDVMTDIYFMTGNTRWLTVAARFNHDSLFGPLANNQDQLNGKHANTNIPKWVGAAREYKASGNATWLAVAKNAWTMTTRSHSYAIGGNSQAEHFKPPNAIAGYLTKDTAEGCNTYNMLKLTRELFTIEPTNAAYFDFYERALYNHMLGWQDPGNSHGHVTYFNSLNPGARRGVGPAWGGGTISTDYNSFWCCQGTGIETNTKFMDSIYFYDASNLIINLFSSSKLNWSAKGVQITQTTTFPASDTSVITVTGSGTFGVRVRIPSWTTGASIAINGVAQSITATPGSYAQIPSQAWTSGTTITIRVPMCIKTIAANDNANIAAVAYGPIVLIGNYGNSAVNSAPTIQLSTVKRTSSTALTFTATANGQNVNMVPYYDGFGFNYVTYWSVSGSVPGCTVGSPPPTGNPPPTTNPPPTQNPPPPPTTPPTTPPPSTPPPSGCSALYGQCGGLNYSGPKCCSQGSCKFSNDWYSQCL